ncbi:MULTISPECIES: type II toxin-antitoxin system HipA family toxin [Rhizobium]|uniref:HipA domain-containing protein n=1 Tax=Rhizobium favelukesii TaxID=348824 RepID=W6RNS0_9HYPH|nr:MULTISPECIES: type II toxin-antitoxin system HipA family toxin [Rhizobium]MCS0457881.1 type II toxin-antitoxin system HipA family toxin [Rhizobium favelukesii]UFS80522.1 type II toxin-antitoxin system HipA family toxin [Rhizobium sp. T136]CDM62394.1 HipA domain-containing protein [Rhizobium favelukesii]
MAKVPAILGVYVLDHALGTIRAGTLTRDADGGVAFVVAETYLRDAKRPILSLGWYDPDDDERTRDRLASRADKIGLRGTLPPWFSGLLPEGALRELVLSEMGPGDHDEFDVLTRLGADLPGAVLIVPETGVPPSAGPLTLQNVHGFKAPLPDGTIKFSLAGVQLKFTANPQGERLTVPGRGDTGRCIIKVGSDRFPGLPEAEHAAMQLAGMIGVRTANCRLVPREAIQGVPVELLAHGKNVLVVDRFDRTEDGRGRIHIEDAGQILGAIGDRKYTLATTETVINMVRRFSSDHRDDIMEAVRRVVADVLLGNGDNHLKNWSFCFPQPGEVRLSPAYDIVPTIFYMPADKMALRFVKTQNFENVDLHRFERVASFLRLDSKWITREVTTVVKRALELWPSAVPDLLGEERAKQIIDRLDTLKLVGEVRG